LITKKCSVCGELKDKDKDYYKKTAPCKICKKSLRKKHYYENREKMIEKSTRWVKSHREKVCIYRREYHAKHKRIVLEHYSNKKLSCACCGESIYAFLSIDHINGGGSKHLKLIKNKEQGNSKNLYFWLIKNNFPKGFQVLCFNCNLGRSINKGICPHHSH
jgi:hypothetical protein